MKSNIIYTKFLLVAALTFGLSACQDEVIVETKDDTKVNELLAAIEAADEQLATLSLEKNTLIVTNVEAEKKIAEYEALRQALLDPYSEPTEVHYTITVLSSSNAVLTSNYLGERAKGYEGATVVVEQNGLVLQPSSAASGLYLFTGLKEGYVYVRVSAPDHTSVEYRAYIYLDNGDDVASAESFNAQTQVVLYPISGPKTAKFIGKAYANTSVLNDTLNRRYGSIAAFGTNANTLISPSFYNFYDYSYYYDGISPFNIYNTTVYGYTYVASYENAMAGHRLYAYPDVNEFANNDYYSENGRVYEIIYKGIVTSTTIGADGSYTLPVISSAEYQNNMVYNIQIYSGGYTAPHTRFTTIDGNYYGQKNEPGSVEVDIKYYNNTDGAIAPYSGIGINTISINPATAASVKRRVITENWWYYPAFGDGSYGRSYNYDIPQAGETRNLNIYFQPQSRN